MKEGVDEIKCQLTQMCWLFCVIHLLCLFAVPVGELCWCHSALSTINNESCPQLNLYFLLRMTQADHEEPSNIIFYLKLLCKAVVASALLINVFVQKTRSYCPLDQPSNITAEKAVNVVCVSVYHEHGTTQTTSTYHKKRRRASKKLATLRDKTTRELKKIKLKQKKQCQRYWFKDENLRKDTRCKEMLIGGLEIKKSAMEAHMTQLQYYVTFSRDQLEMQRERNKIIQDNIDQCGKHVVGNNNIPSYQEGVAR